jgi:hypothetical protein
VPSKPEAASGDDNNAFAYLRAGWGGRATYKQTVELPCAVYRLEYWAININASATKGKNLSKVTCRKDTWKDETGFNDKEWTLHTIEFTPTSEFSMEFGFESEGGSGSNPFLCIDGIKLYKIGEADPVKLIESDFHDLMDECQELAGRTALSDFLALSAQISDYGFDLENAIDGDAVAMEAALKAANVKMETIRTDVNQMESINAILDKMKNLLETTDFAGKADFEAAYRRILSYKEDENIITTEVKEDLSILPKAGKRTWVDVGF